MKEARLIVVVDDLDFESRDVTFEAKVFNKYGTFDWIANNSIEDLGYAYLHCNFLDKVALTITLRMNLSYIDMHEQHLQKGMFVRVNFLGISSKSKKGFEKDDMHVVITIELRTILSLIHAFQLELIPMFFHMDSIKKFISFIQSWKSTTIVVIIIGGKGVKDNKGENQLLTIDGEGEFDQDVFNFDNNFILEYEQLHSMEANTQWI